MTTNGTAEFKVGDKIVHPTHGVGRVVEVLDYTLIAHFSALWPPMSVITATVKPWKPEPCQASPAKLKLLASPEYHAHVEAQSEIARHHRDFETISAYCTLVRSGEMTAGKAIKKIQNIVG